MEHFSVLKRKLAISHEKTWGKFKYVLLSEITQPDIIYYIYIYTTYYMSSTM